MRKRIMQAAPIAAIPWLASGIVVLVFWGGSRAPAEEKAPPPTQTQTQETAKPVQVIPAEEKNRKNPIPATPDSIEAGQNLYSSQCAMCHGQTGNGKGDLAEKMRLKVPD